MTIKMATLKQSSMMLLLLSCCYHQFQPVHSFTFQRIAYPKHRHRCQRNIENLSSGSVLCAQRNPENNSKQPKTDDDKDDDPVEEFLAREEASKKVTRRLMLPRMIMTSIGESVRYLAWGFVIVSFGLNVAGYSLIRDGDSLRIGTLEDQDFQMEINKSMKEK